VTRGLNNLSYHIVISKNLFCQILMLLKK